MQVQVLLAEITMVEEEIIGLEKKVKDLRLHLYQEREQNDWDLQQQWQHQQMKFLCGSRGQKDIEEPPHSFCTETGCQSPKDERDDPLELVAETSSISCRKTIGMNIA